MIVGFSGTRKGMTAAQRAAVANLLRDLKPAAVHQGCCVGADADFCRLVMDGGEAGVFPDCIGWPSDIESMTSTTANMTCHEIHQPQPPLVRNRCIVDACDVLIACPAEAVEQQRGGTWSTVRYARRSGKRVLLVTPGGGVNDSAKEDDE